MKLADALLRRKELQQKVDQLRNIKEQDLHEFLFERKQVNENLDDIKAKVLKVHLSEITEAYDYYANKLRLIDASIQQLNWTTDITVDSMVFKDFEAKEKKAS